MADSLIAIAHIQIGFTRYRPGDKLPEDSPDVGAWLEAGTAAWIPENEIKHDEPTAKLVTAEPGLFGIAVGGECTGSDLVGRIPRTESRRRK